MKLFIHIRGVHRCSGVNRQYPKTAPATETLDFTVAHESSMFLEFGRHTVDTRVTRARVWVQFSTKMHVSKLDHHTGDVPKS